jgi:two-component system alkaline phosphatase synthesis response regulator PhoP
MPIMDGVTFLSHLRRREDTELIPFILLTARSSDEDKVDGLLLGADGTPVLC